MSRLVPSLVFASVLATAGVAVAQVVDHQKHDPEPTVAQQAQAPRPAVPGREARERDKEAVGADAERARARVALPPELKALRDEMVEQVEDLRTIVNKKYEEAGAKALSYALWAAAGLFAIMVLASVVGGVIVALIFRRSRS